MSSSIKSIVNEDVRNKVVILRADLNIPIVNGVVQDHTRIKRLMPTINYLLANVLYFGIFLSFNQRGSPSLIFSSFSFELSRSSSIIGKGM